MEATRKKSALSVNMTEGSLWKNMLLFSLPLMLTQVLEVLFNLSDVAIAGKGCSGFVEHLGITLQYQESVIYIRRTADICTAYFVCALIPHEAYIAINSHILTRKRVANQRI